MRNQPSAIRRAYVWALLRFYPRSFRNEWGADVADCLNEILDTESRNSAAITTARLYLGAFWDASTEGTRERGSVHQTQPSTATKRQSLKRRP